MAVVKSRLLRKLRKVLTQRFPPPSTVKLEDYEGVVGVVTSASFAGMDSIDRQSLIGDILANHLTQEERWQVQLIVAVTPDEGTGYLASVD